MPSGLTADALGCRAGFHAQMRFQGGELLCGLGRTLLVTGSRPPWLECLCKETQFPNVSARCHEVVGDPGVRVSLSSFGVA